MMLESCSLYCGTTLLLSHSYQRRPELTSHTTPRVLSRAYRVALGKDAGARALILDLERDPLFADMLNTGVVRKLSVRGFRDASFSRRNDLAWAIRFVEANNLDRKAKWSSLLESEYPSDLDAVAAACGVPKEDLHRAIRILQGSVWPSGDKPLLDDSRRACFRGTEKIDDDQVQAIGYFVRKYGLSQQDFVDYALSERASATKLATRFGCPLDEAKELLNAVTSIVLYDLLPDGWDRGVPNEGIVAEITVKNGLEVRFNNTWLVERYAVDRDLLAQYFNDSQPSAGIRSVLDRIEAINERAGALTAIVQVICRKQMDFIYSGNAHALLPLSRSEVARATQYHRSVVSRLVSEKNLRLPHGIFALQDLLPSVGEVVRYLVSTRPDWSDHVVALHMSERYGIPLSRRTVNYHRHRICGRKFIDDDCLDC